MQTIELGTPISINYLGSGTNAVANARSRIASGDIALPPADTGPENAIVAVDNIDAQVDGFPLSSVIVYGAAKGDAYNLLLDAHASAAARLAAIDEQIAALS